MMLGRLLLCLFPLVLLAIAPAGASAATYTVNSTTDVGDAFLPDGVCDITGNPGPPPVPYLGQCSLRAAIQQANANPGRDEINILVTAVPVTLQLPAITGPVFIQPTGTSRATITWVGAGTSGDALFFTIGGNAVRRLAVLGFSGGAAIRLTGGGGNSIIGTELTNNQVGLAMWGSPSNEIGTDVSGRGNVISGNGTGIYILGGASTGNRIVGNFIGVDESGLAALPNRIAGIYIEGASGSLIGLPAAGNIISGNTGPGIYVVDSDDTQIMSNRIGTDGLGVTSLGNGGSGIFLRNARRSQIGGPSIATGTTTTSPSTGTVVGRAQTPTAGKFPGNVIAANGGNGILIDGASSTLNVISGNMIGLGFDGSPLGNYDDGVEIDGGSSNKVGLPAQGGGNFISSNGRAGVRVAEATATDNLVQNNWIGTGLTGSERRGNATIGVMVDGAKKTIVGGTRDAERNLISANGSGGGVFGSAYTPPPAGNYAGVHIRGGSATDNRIAGNIIGMDRDGLIALSNSGAGVVIDDGGDNWVGGLVDASTGYFPRNLISGNGGSGVIVRGAAVRNRIVGNYIGSDATGAPSAGSIPLTRTQDVGVWIDRAPGNFIGDDDAKGRNVIVHSVAQGILITGSSANGNVVRSNYIGVDESGMIAFPNGESGIVISDASDTLIGGGTPTPGKAPSNIISSHRPTQPAGAIQIQGASATRNRVMGNLIGLAADGKTALPNAHDGILITDGASKNVIGGDATEDGNVIAHNERVGVAVSTGQSLTDATANTILYNVIHSNKVLGIDLGLDRASPNPKRTQAGIVTAVGPGPNDKRASPNLFLLPGPDPGWGTLEGPPNKDLRVQFFGSKLGHVSGYGEGERYIGTKTVTTNQNGFAKFTVMKADAGEVLSATATDDQGNTSEFSRLPCVIAPVDAAAIDPALVDTSLQVQLRWIEPANSPPSSSPAVGKPLIPLAAGTDTALNLEIQVTKANPAADDDLTKAFVVVTVNNLAATPGAPAMRIFREALPLDATGKTVKTLSVDEMLREMGAAENRNFLEARAHICYRGRVRTASTDKVLHVLREKLVLFLPGVLGSKIGMSVSPAPAVPAVLTDVFPTFLPISSELAMNNDGTPVRPAERLGLFDSAIDFPVFSSITSVYAVVGAIQRARVINQLPQVTIGGRTVDYFQLQAWPYDWRLRLDQHVGTLVNGPANPAVGPQSVQRLVADFKASNRFADDKAALVGHSTGGLIVRSSLVGAAGSALRNHVDRAYFLNTPFLGAPKAYYAFLTGDMGFAVGTLILPSTLRALAPNMPVMYHLAPAPGYYDESNSAHPDKGDVVARYDQNGAIEEGKRFAPTDDAHLFMDDLIALAGSGQTWNRDLEQQADSFHRAIGRRRPVIGWANTLVFASANPGFQTPGRVTYLPFMGVGGVRFDSTLGDQTVPLDSQIGNVPDYATVQRISANALEHVAAASDERVWDEMLDHMAAREEKDFTGATPDPSDLGPISPPAAACAGLTRHEAIQAAEVFGEGEMNARAAAKKYATILQGAQRAFRQGFDAVYCDGETVAALRLIGQECQGTIVVGEGKGGYAGQPLEYVLGSGYGYRQGTLEWAANAAQATIAGSGDTEQVEVSRSYHLALEAGVATRIEVFHSECVSNYPNKQPGPLPAQLLFKRYVADQTP